LRSGRNYGLRDGEIRCLAQADERWPSDAASRPARRSAWPPAGSSLC